MLSTILWIIGGLIALSILIAVLKILFVILGVRKMINIVKTEVEELPKDYDRARKEVTNENSTVGEKIKFTAKNVAKTGWRFFKHSRDL